LTEQIEAGGDEDADPEQARAQLSIAV
jgi:hypothetical protein